MARLLCRIFGHRIERIYLCGRVGALWCSRCDMRHIFPAPGLVDT